jgi:hypothetical protein
MMRSILSLVIVMVVAAQPGVAQLVRNTISTPWGKKTITTPGRNQAYFGSSNSRIQKFKVVLKNDSSFVCQTRIDLNEKIPTIKVRLQEDSKK